MGASWSAGTWLAIVAGVLAIALGWVFFAVAMTTDAFSDQAGDNQAKVPEPSPSDDGDLSASVDGVSLDQHLASVDARISALEEARAGIPAVSSLDGGDPSAFIDGVSLDQHLASVDARISALEDALDAQSQASLTGGVPPHDHQMPSVSTFPHTWTQTGNTLPEDFLQVHIPEGLWHFEFEAACIGDMSSCPRPGDNLPYLRLLDLADDPFDYPDGVESGTDWCEEFEVTRAQEWRLWVTYAHGVTWSLTIDKGQCPGQSEEFVPGMAQ